MFLEEHLSTKTSYSFGQLEENTTNHVVVKNRHLFLTVLEAEKFKTKLSADVEPGKGSLPYSYCCLVLSSRGRMKEGSSLGPLCEDTNPIHEGSIFSKGPCNSSS